MVTKSTEDRVQNFYGLRDPVNTYAKLETMPVVLLQKA